MSGAGRRPGVWLLDVAAGVGGPPPVETQNLLELANRHGLLGLLADPQSPAHWPLVTPVHTRLAARQNIMLEHLAGLTSAFHDAGIPLAILKGPWLAANAYRVSRHRTFSDLDLLVPRESLPGALEIIGQHPGVRSIPRQKPEADKREIPVYDPSGISFAVDLHWDLFSYRQLGGRAQHGTGEAWKEAELRPDSPLGPTWDLPLSALWAFLATHATFDHRFRLILFRDLLELVAVPIDWDGVIDFTTRHGLRSTTYVALRLARQWVQAPIPEDVLVGLRPASLPVWATERLALNIDPIEFDGHRVHPLNLAMVLLHDDRVERLKLVARAPAAVPGWWRKVRSWPLTPGPPLATIVVVGTRRRGAEVFGERLGSGLFGAGWQSDLVALIRTPDGPEVAAMALVDDRPRLPRLDWRIVRRLRRRIVATRPEVVLANGSATLKYTALALLGLRKRPAFLYASVGEPIYWTKGWLRVLAQRMLLSRADLVLAVSSETARQLVEDLRQPADRVVVTETGVEPSLLEIEPGQPDEALHILVLGSLSVEKDPELAVDVFARFSRTHLGRLRFVGAGPLEEAVARRASEQGVVVEIVGAVADVSSELAWADVLLLTSRTEGLPGAALEAGAAGKPAVGFNVGGMSEAIINGETGYVVEAGDVSAAAAALSRIADDPALRRRLGEKARSRVSERFLLTHAIERYRNVFESVRALTR